MTDERRLETDIWRNKLESLELDWRSARYIDPDVTTYTTNVNNVLQRLRLDWGAIDFLGREHMIDLLLPPGGLTDIKLSFHHSRMPSVKYGEIYKYFPKASLLVPRESAELLESGDQVFKRMISGKGFYRSPKGQQSWIYYDGLTPSGARVVRDPQASGFGNDPKMKMRYAQMMKEGVPLAFNPDATIPNFVLIEYL